MLHSVTQCCTVLHSVASSPQYQHMHVAAAAVVILTFLCSFILNILFGLAIKDVWRTRGGTRATV